MKVKVFIWTILWMSIALIVIGLFHYPIIDRVEYNQEVNQTINTSIALQYDLDYTIKSLKLNVESLSKNIDSGDVWLDQALSFLENNKSVKEIHLYDTDRLHDRVQAQREYSVTLDKKSLEGLFFYQPMIVETYDNQNVVAYYKGKSSYFMLLIDLEGLFESILPVTKGMSGVYDQHIVPILTKGENLNGRTFFNDAAQAGQNNGYTEEVFYAIQKINFENMPLNILVADLDQTYKKHMRLYLVRFLLLSLLLLTTGFLVAWRIVKVFRQSVLSSRLSKITELSDIKKNINLAINHMGMAAKSFDDINVLKEELETLYADLEEGVGYEENINVEQKDDTDPQ